MASVQRTLMGCRLGRAWAFAVIAILVLAVLAGMSGAAAKASAAAHAAPAAPPVSPGADLTSLVNPFIGTENAGLDFPAVGAPFGMVQETPLVVTRAGVKSHGNGCYPDPADEIEGFSQSSINGCRFNYVPLMPTTGPITSTDPAHYGSPFGPADEQVHPDSAQVQVPRYGIKVDLTATTRTGWQRYTFPRTSAANVLFNTGAGVTTSQIRIVGDDTVEGWVDDFHRTYFYAQFSRPFTAYGTWKGSHLHPGSRSSVNPTTNGGWVSFDTTHDDSPVVVKLALSYTGIAGAQANLAAETGHSGFDFDGTQRALHARWNALLHGVEVGGGSHDQQVALYTALYHATLDPNVIGDVDGRYMGFDGKIHHASGFTPYSNLSLWDTYRTQNELVELLDPKVSHDIDLSILAIGKQAGWLPRWFLGDQENNIMTGDPITPYLVEGWSKGLLTGADAQEAYQEIRENATRVPPASVPMNGRAGVGYFDRLGYIPYGLKVTSESKCPSEGAGAACCPTHGNDNDCYYAGSAPLEYSAADASLALMAKGLGHTADADMFARLGQSYRNLFDRSIDMFQPRTLNGQWLSPYVASTGDHAFHEGDPAQYQWLVPQDPAGLASLLGGRQAMTNRLNQFFAYPQLANAPASTARHAWVSAPYDYYGPSTYNPDNETDLLAPYLYAWTGHPANTATVVRAAETLFTNSPTGVTGNDDMGEMSAWYVMSAIGLYPVLSGSNFYVMTTPEFPHTVVHVGTWNTRQGGTLDIAAPGASMQDRYIASAKVNGQPWTRDWVGQDAIAHGGSIDERVSASPSAWATGARSDPPSVDTSADPQHTLSVSATPAATVVEPSATNASRQQITLSLMVTAPGTAHVQLTATAPPGWTASTAQPTVTAVSDGVPTQVKVPLTVTAPAGTPAGAYTTSVLADMAGTTPVRTTIGLSAGGPGGCALQTSSACAVDLSAAANVAGAATLADPHLGDFDGQGGSYAADLLPPAGPLTLGGVAYEAPATSGRDFVRAEGQSIALPAGNYSSLDVLGAASNGSTGSAGDTATVTYADGSSAAVPLRFTDWGSAHPDFSNTVAVRMPYGVTAKGKRSSTRRSLYRTTVPLDPNKTVRSISLPTPSVPIWVAPGLTGLAWEYDSDLQIYAMTLQH